MMSIKTLVLAFAAAAVSASPVQPRGEMEVRAGRGLSMNDVCHQQFGSAALPVIKDQSWSGWKCNQNGVLYGIDMDRACRDKYGSGSRATHRDAIDSWLCT